MRLSLIELPGCARRLRSARAVLTTVAATVMALFVLWPSASLEAHEVPRRVVVRAFVHPDGSVVRVLVRVPLEAMRDVEFPQRGAYLDVARADSALRDAAQLWVAQAIRLYADGEELPAARVMASRASLPSDGAFADYASALAQLRGPSLPPATEIPVPQVLLDVMLEFPIAGVTANAASARLAIAPALAHLGITTSTVLRYLPATGAERSYLYDGDPGVVQLEPAWWHAAARFVVMGARHLVEGIDHLLFLICLVLPVRRLRPLIGIVTAFTVAHSITLALTAFGHAPDALWFPPLVECLIAASIVYMAIENVVGASLDHRWRIAFGFGLVHGFGFAYSLGESLQFAGGHLVTALAAFNVGIELAQLAVLLVAVPVLSWCFTHLVAERTGRIVGSVLVAHTAWHWMTERFDVLRTYRFTWPALDATLAIALMRAAMVGIAIGAVAWLLSGLVARLSATRPRGSAAAPLLLALAMSGAVLVGLPRTMWAQGAQPAGGTRTTMSGVYTADQAAKGKEVFTGTCMGCHTAASHSGAAFAVRWVGRPLSEFYDYVSRLMPKSAPGTLSEDEYVWVTAYVLKLNGMPPSTRELSAEPAQLKGIRIDTTRTAATGGQGQSTKDFTRDARENP